MDVKTIKVVDALTNSCLLASELGELLYQLLQRELQTNSEIELDFENYKYMSKSFLQFSIGRLCFENRWRNSEFEKRIHILNMDEDDLEEVELVLTDAQMQFTLQHSK